MPDRKQERRPEFEVAYYTKELGQALQRQMLQKQLARFSSSNAASNERDSAPDPAEGQPARDDTA